MKDKQIPASSAEPRIPFVSAALHCVSMSALVYLRHSFGFGFLRPKSVFFAFSWVFTLYSVYAWFEPSVWRDHRGIIVFGCATILLYWLHFSIAFKREVSQTAEHEHYSGTSHLTRLLRRRNGQPLSILSETILHVWIEPGAVLLVAVLLRHGFGEEHLSGGLSAAAVCLWSKEALNFWFHIRRQKRQDDVFADTAEIVEPPTTSNLATDPPKATRKEKVKRARSGADAPESAVERRQAELLRLLPPYSLVAAEANYRKLVTVEHPDAHENSEESNARTAELNEAIEYFRHRHRQP